MTFEDALKLARDLLSRSPALLRKGTLETESEQIVIGAFRRATGRGRTFSRADLYVRVIHPFPSEGVPFITRFCEERVQGKALQYVLGYQYFLNHEYEVDPSVLIPRPETEILVFETMQFLKRDGIDPKLGVEVGLGSGCVSIELLKIFHRMTMVASELSTEAQAVAERNARAILGEGPQGTGRLKIRTPKSATEVLEPFPEPAADGQAIRADFIVSNPPYLDDFSEMDEEVEQNEPHHALLAPHGDPLYFYRRIAEDAPKLLVPKGLVFLEVPHERAREVADLYRAKDYEVAVMRDLTDRERVVRARLKR